MAENPLTVDLIRLRAVANRAEQAADAIGRFRCAGLHDGELPGSAVSAVACPTRVAARLDDVVATLQGWAATARRSADAFDAAEQNGVARLDRP